MPKMLKIEDDASGYSPWPLRVTHRKMRSVPRKDYSCYIAPSVRVKCGCCDEAVVMFPGVAMGSEGSAHEDTLEINGVHGTVHQWRQVLLPLLGVSVPEDATMSIDPEAAVLQPFFEQLNKE